mgnify:CR=1 FL=1
MIENKKELEQSEMLFEKMASKNILFLRNLTMGISEKRYKNASVW